MNSIYKDYRPYTSITLTCFSMLALAACGSSAIDSESQDSALDGEPASTQPAGAGADNAGGPAQPSGEMGQPAACVQAFAPDTPGKVCNVTYGGLCFESNDVACACAGCPLDGDHASCTIALSYPAQASCERPTAPTSSSNIDPDCAVSDTESGSVSNGCGGGDIPPTGDVNSSTSGGGSNAGADNPGGPAQQGGEQGQPAACVQAFAPDTPGKVCNVTYGGLCFESNDVACACAGCPLDANGASSSCLIDESFPAQAYCERPTAPTSPSNVDPDCAVSDTESGSVSNGCGGGDIPPTGDVNSSTSGGGSNGSDGSGASCAGGFAADSTEGVCNATYGDLCFEDDAAACACAGCPIDSSAGCLVAESYPTQVSCP